MGNGSKLYKEKFARRDKIAQRQICTRGQNYTKTILHGGSFLHESKIKKHK